jgi:hypothetical protein
LTKYYYRDSQLCYQILAQSYDGRTFVIEDFNNFSDYKRSIQQIEDNLESGMVVEVKQYPTEDSVLSAVA